MRSRSKPSSVNRLRRLLTSPLMRLVIFILLIVLAMLEWLCFKSSASSLKSSVSASSSLHLSSASCFSNNFLAWIKQGVYQLSYPSLPNRIIKRIQYTCGLRAEASQEPSFGPLCSSRQTWRGVTGAEMCSEILLFSLLPVGLLQEKHTPINSQSICVLYYPFHQAFLFSVR